MLDDTLELVADYDWGRSGAPLLELKREIRKVAEHSEQRAELEARLLEILQGDASLAARRFVCQALGVIGSARSVGVLAKLLDKERTADMARYALERISAPEADDALRAALERTDGRGRVGVINSLGARKDRGAVEQLGALLADLDAETAAAAAWALGQIADDAALATVTRGELSGETTVRLAQLDARLACAEQLVADGRADDAEAIYQDIDGAEAPAHIRAAAVVGRLRRRVDPVEQ